MSASNSKDLANETTSGSSSTTLKRPLNPILAPSKLSFGVGSVNNDKATSSSSSSSSSLTLAPSKLAFPGLKASKLSSVTQTVCASSKSQEEANNDKSPAPKPSFIPLTKESSKTLGENSNKPQSAPNSNLTVTPPTVNATSTTIDKASSFVFGQKLNDRAANFASSNGSTKPVDSTQNEQENLNFIEGSTTAGDVSTTNTEKTPKSLTESAAEYCETRNKKVELSEVELITGEESEANVCQMSAKLYLFDKSTSSWLERGRGQIRLNDLRPLNSSSEDSSSPSSRLIMRTVGSLRVILNSKIFPEMTVEKPTEKNIRLTAMDDLNQGLRVFLVSGSPKDIGLLYVALTHRVESLRNSLSSPIKNEETEKSVKRKLDEDEDRFSKEESPPPEKEPKIAC